MNHLSTSQIFQKVRRMLGAAPPHRVQVAALPWRRVKGGIEVMLITSRDTGRWVLPKGWPEAGEEFYDAAAREAVEEAGLKGIISSHEAGRYFYDKCAVNRDDIRCEVFVYPLEVSNVADKWKEKGERKRKWVSPEKAAGMVAEPDLAEVIRNFRRAA